MKKLLSAVFFLTLCCSAANAHPVKVTLSNGQVVYLESDNYQSAADMIADIIRLENQIH